MRILEVINSLEPAGAERLVHDLCLEFRRRGISVSVFLLEAKGGSFEARLRDHAIPIFSSRARRLHSPLHAMDLAEHLSRYPYDVVHAHLFPTQLWASLAHRVSGRHARLFTTEHSFTTRRRRRSLRPLDTWLYGQFEAVCCVSESATHSFRQWMPRYGSRALTVPNGFDPRRFSGAQSRDVERTRILSIGRCEPVKRHDVLLRALAILPEASLWIAGDGPCRPRLEALARDLGVASRVRFLGRRSDLEHMIPQCGLFVQSSDHEGFGIAALEAMACGLPVICADVPGLRDAVGDAALKFPAGNHVLLADRLRSVFGDTRLAAAMSAASRERARSFSIATTADKYLTLYGAPAPAQDTATLQTRVTA